jgi:Mg2+ and Co2+ transporter CorA
MLTADVTTPEGVKPVPIKDISDFPDNTVWLDLPGPSRSEEQAIKSFLGIEAPTSQEDHP